MASIALPLETVSVPLRDLRPHSHNPRRGGVAAIAESLRRHRQYRPIVVNRPRMEVLAGNHTLLAALELGWSALDATFVSVDEEQAKRILLVDNRTSDLAGYDLPALADLLEDLPDLEGTGYDQAELGALLDELAPVLGADDEVPPLPSEPETRPGDLYILGEHRLVCGDARDPDAYARLLAGERCEALWTDPPYGVEYEGRTKRALRIENDGHAGLEGLLTESFAAANGSSPPVPACMSPTPPESSRSPSEDASSPRAGGCARRSCG